jgi:hypothetical protein
MPAWQIRKHLQQRLCSSKDPLHSQPAQPQRAFSAYQHCMQAQHSWGEAASAHSTSSTSGWHLLHKQRHEVPVLPLHLTPHLTSSGAGHQGGLSHREPYCCTRYFCLALTMRCANPAPQRRCSGPHALQHKALISRPWAALDLAAGSARAAQASSECKLQRAALYMQHPRSLDHIWHVSQQCLWLQPVCSRP